MSPPVIVRTTDEKMGRMGERASRILRLERNEERSVPRAQKTAVNRKRKRKQAYKEAVFDDDNDDMNNGVHRSKLKEVTKRWLLPLLQQLSASSLSPLLLFQSLSLTLN